jgi:hypothetical protein
MSPDDHAHDNSHGHPHASIEDAPLGYYARMQEAVQELLIESGVLTADEIRRAVEAMTSEARHRVPGSLRAPGRTPSSRHVFSPMAPRRAGSSASKSGRPA